MHWGATRKGRRGSCCDKRHRLPTGLVDAGDVTAELRPIGVTQKRGRKATRLQKRRSGRIPTRVKEGTPAPALHVTTEPACHGWTCMSWPGLGHRHRNDRDGLKRNPHCRTHDGRLSTRHDAGERWLAARFQRRWCEGPGRKPAPMTLSCRRHHPGPNGATSWVVGHRQRGCHSRRRSVPHDERHGCRPACFQRCGLHAGPHVCHGFGARRLQASIRPARTQTAR